MKKKTQGLYRVSRYLLPGLLACVLAALWIIEYFLLETPTHIRGYDPQMPYFLNSLAIFKSEPYQYIDHPGTPVELIGTFLMGLMRPFVGLRSDSYILYLLENPEKFFLVGYAFLTIASMATIIMLSRFSLRLETTRDVLQGAGIGALFFVLLPPISYSTLLNWSHNSFNFAFGSLLLLGLYLVLLREKLPSLQAVAALGFGAGVLTAVQLYFSTWVIGIALSVGIYIYLTSKRFTKTILYSSSVIVSSVVGFILSTLPILHRYREFTWWIKSLIFHQGKYGYGASGITTLPKLFHNLTDLVKSMPLPYLSSLFLVTLLAIAVWHLRSSLSKRPEWIALSIGLTIQLIITHILILKHPATTYLLAIAAILPFILALSVSAFQNNRGKMSFFISGLSILVLLSFAYGALRMASSRIEFSNRLSNLVEEATQMRFMVAEEAGKSQESIAVLWGYGTASSCFALRFGDIYSGGVFDSEIENICPDDWMYDVWSEKAILPNGPQDLINSDEWDLLVVPAKKRPQDMDHAGKIFYSEYGTVEYITRSVTDYEAED